MEALRWIEASDFAMFVKESSTTYTTFLALHTIGLAFLVGISGALALRVLGVARDLPLAPLEGFLPLMWAGFWINAATGVVLLLLYPTTFLKDATLYIKLGGIVVAMATLRALRSRLFGGSGAPEAAAGAPEAKRLAVGLLAAWLVAITAGRVMAYTLPTKLQTAAAVVVAMLLLLAIGYLAARGLRWIRTREGVATGQGA